MIEVRRADGLEITRLEDEGWIPRHESFLRDRDVTLVSYLNGSQTGIALMRPMWWVHGFDTAAQDNGLIRMESARSLLAYGLGLIDGLARPGDPPAGILFQLRRDNAAMERFLSSPSTVAEPDDQRIIRIDNFNPRR